MKPISSFPEPTRRLGIGGYIVVAMLIGGTLGSILAPAILAGGFYYPPCLMPFGTTFVLPPGLLFGLVVSRLYGDSPAAHSSLHLWFWAVVAFLLGMLFCGVAMIVVIGIAVASC